MSLAQGPQQGSGRLGPGFFLFHGLHCFCKFRLFNNTQNTRLPAYLYWAAGGSFFPHFQSGALLYAQDTGLLQGLCARQQMNLVLLSQDKAAGSCSKD